MGLLLVTSTALGAQTAERHALGGGAVAVHNLVGRMSVVGAPGGDVLVEVTRRGADADRLTIQKGPRGEWQTIRVIYPERRIVYPELGRNSRSNFSVGGDGFIDGGGRGWDSRDRVEVRGTGSGLEAWADVRVTVPRGGRVAVFLGAGEVLVSNVDGDLRVHANAGRVTTDGTRGRLAVETGSGGVRVTGASGDVDIEVGSGGATVRDVTGRRLHLTSGSGGLTASGIDVQDLNAETGSGGVRLSGVRARTAEIETGSGGTEVELLSDPDDVRIETGSGGVTLRMPATAGAELDVESGSGGVHSDFAVRVRRVERNALRGTIGDGRGRISIETGSGTVRLIAVGPRGDR